jgi:xanthine dehydrogenase accessory factor
MDYTDTELMPSRGLVTDDPIEILNFAALAFEDGPVALATLTEIRGGAARALGSHMAIASDGRFCGYVSGGCVEAAVASEALCAMRAGCDRIVKFGEGSPFFDIVLPCGGGISVAIHLLRNTAAIKHVIGLLKQRQPAALLYSPTTQSIVTADAMDRSRWKGKDFATVYQPATCLIISGQDLEADSVGRIARASGYDVNVCSSRKDAATLRKLINRYTAVVLLHHDLDQELPMLRTALNSSAFYIGALGSTRTHRLRVTRLQSEGYQEDDLCRIRAPIGIFGPTRDAASLALSVLADIASARLRHAREYWNLE